MQNNFILLGCSFLLNYAVALGVCMNANSPILLPSFTGKAPHATRVLRSFREKHRTSRQAESFNNTKYCKLYDTIMLKFIN